MGRKRKATLRSHWWKSFFASIQFCFKCGEKLVRQYVKAERSRRHVCVSCSEITYLNPKVVAGLIPIMPDGKVALLKRDIEPGFGKWSYPAGYQELGETVEEAAARETWEEIRVRVKVGKMIGIYSYVDAGVVTVVYEGRVIKNGKPKAGVETSGVELFKPNEIPWEKLAFRSTVHALKDWKRKRK